MIVLSVFLAVLMSYYLWVTVRASRTRSRGCEAAPRLVGESVGAAAHARRDHLGYMVWSIAPVVIAILFSFNNGRSRSVWQGFSTRWYWGDPNLSVLHDPTMRGALEQSLKLAGLDMLIAVPLGAGLAIGLTRWRGFGARPVTS